MTSAQNLASGGVDRELDRWKRMLDDNLRNFSAMRQLGVSFVAGTDAGWRLHPL